MKRSTLIGLAIAGALLIAGLLLGDARQVLANASLLCLSCIGIG